MKLEEFHALNVGDRVLIMTYNPPIKGYISKIVDKDLILVADVAYPIMSDYKYTELELCTE
jgi:hypothetical protein